MADSKDLHQTVDDEARRLAKTLLRSARYASLAVIEPQSGSPAVSRINVTTDMHGRPGFLISRLSGHFAALEADPRCSLMVGEPGRGDPLAHPRITVNGKAELIVDDEERGRLKSRFLFRHPKAAGYADFGDIALWRLEPRDAALYAGFGKAFKLQAADILTPLDGFEALAAREPGSVGHMNEDHRDAIDHYAMNLLGKDKDGWLLAGIDPEGMDLIREEDTARLWFDPPLSEPQDLRPRLVELSKTGRQ